MLRLPDGSEEVRCKMYIFSCVLHMNEQIGVWCVRACVRACVFLGVALV